MEKKVKQYQWCSEKRKLKRQQECLAKIPKLSNFLKQSTSILSNFVKSPSTSRDGEELENDDNKEKMQVDFNDDKIHHCTEDLHKSTINFDKDINNDCKIGQLFSTDIADFQSKILTDDVKKVIILSDSCRPRGPFKRDPLQNNHKFSEEFYKSSTKYGYVERLWLCYSPKLDAVYCEPCWLFLKNLLDNW